MSNFATRAIVAVIGGTLLVWSAFFPQPVFLGIIIVLIAGALVETAAIFRKSKSPLALAYILLVIGGFAAVYVLKTRSPYLLLTLFFTTWATDVGAYLVGMKFGKTPFAPTISPKKTWEGAVGGFVISVIVGLIAASQWNTPAMIAFGAIAGTIGQIGDLLESKLKRQAGVKDSSTILPGHGGILDRFDSFIANAPVCLLVATLA